MQDSSTGLYYIGARWMDLELGRWCSLDPELGSLSMPQTTSRYVYCVNNPLGYVDPWGLFPGAVGPPRDRYVDPLYDSGWDLLDDIMNFIGYIPVADTVSDVYFLGKAVYHEDWETAAFYAGCAAVPFVGSSWLKSGTKAAGKGLGIGWLDDLATIGKRADDVPTGPAVKNADDMITVRHYTDTSTARTIEASGYRKKHSWVGHPAHIKRGMTQNDIADLLALPTPSKAECYIDVQVRLSDIYIDPAQGLKAQPLFGWKGGGFQFRLAKDISIGNARFLPTFWG